VTRGRRILVELLGPPLVGATLFDVVAGVVTGDATALAGLPLFLFFGVLFAAVPSIAFTLIMEVAYVRGLDPAGWRAVRLSALAGVLCGLLVTLWFEPWRSPAPLGPLAGFAAIGSATGAIVGAIVRARSR
jgi:hypothetical protein